MIAELQRPSKLIPRWIGHGDLTIIIDGPYVYLRAVDVESLAHVPAWGEGETIIGDEWPEELVGEAMGSEPYYELDQAIAKCRRHVDDQPAAAAFLAWLDATLPDLVDPEVVESARRPTPLVDAITVQRAARRLTEQGLRIGRTGLFSTLEQLGWTRRAGESWTLTALATDRQWATVRQIRHPDPRRKHETYEQIYITSRGFERLREDLAVPDLEMGHARLVGLPLFELEGQP